MSKHYGRRNAAKLLMTFGDELGGWGCLPNTRKAAARFLDFAKISDSEKAGTA